MSGMAGSLRLLRDHRGFLGLLLCLYFAQGLPSGLIAHALPALLRDAGVSLSVIGLTGLIAAPWMLKFLWAPFVDRYGSRRRSSFWTSYTATGISVNWSTTWPASCQ